MYMVLMLEICIQLTPKEVLMAHTKYQLNVKPKHSVQSIQKAEMSDGCMEVIYKAQQSVH